MTSRDPETGKGSRDVKLYAEVVDRIRSSGVDCVVNLTAGMGGDLMIDPNNPSVPAAGTDLVPPLERLAHVEELLPDICSLDCGSLNFGEGNSVYVSTPDMLRTMAKRVQELGVKPVGFTADARSALLSEDWLGNVRELSERVRQAIRLSGGGAISAEALLLAADGEQVPSFKDAKRAFETRYVTGLLRRCKGNISRAARLAKKDRKDFYDVIRRTGVDPQQFRS